MSTRRWLRPSSWSPFRLPKISLASVAAPVKARGTQGKKNVHTRTGRKPMPRLSLDALAQRLSEQLQCEQEDLCRSILHQVSRGKPLAKASLATMLEISQNELEQRLARVPDTEFDQEGNIIGWGVTLM